MSNPIEIGWCLTEGTQKYYFHDYRKKETMKSLFPHDGKEKIPDFFYCPPIMEYYKNCFGYYAISDVNLVIENGNLHFLQGHKHSIPKIGDSLKINEVFTYGNHNFEFLLPDEIFISDTPNVTVEILPHPLAKYKNVIGAEMNIHKWIRSIHVPYYHDDSIFHYQVDKGEPLCLIKFNTPNNESVKLVELDNDKIKKYSNPRESVNIENGSEGLDNVKNWLKYFDIFMKKRPKNLIDYARIDK